MIWVNGVLLPLSVYAKTDYGLECFLDLHYLGFISDTSPVLLERAKMMNFHIKCLF